MATPPGVSYSQSVYRDALRVIQSGSTNTTAYAMGGAITPADLKLIEAAWSRGDRSTYDGYMPLEAGDAALIYVLGDDENETVLLGVSVYDEFGEVVSGQYTPIRYEERLVGIFTFTIGAQAADADPAITGLAVTDLWADGVVQSVPDPALAVPANQPPPGVVLFSPANDHKAYIIVPSDGAKLLRVQTDRGTSDRALVIAKKIRGDAMRS